MSAISCILAILVLSTASAAPSPQMKPDEVVILEQKNNFNGIDPWQWSYKTSDGQSREESGALTPDGKSVKLQGGYKWMSPEGTIFTIMFTADDRGFMPMVTQKAAGEPLRVQGPPLNGGPTHQDAAGGQLLVQEQPLDGDPAQQDAAGGQLTVQEQPLDGGQAKQDATGGKLMVKGAPLDGGQADQDATDGQPMVQGPAVDEGLARQDATGGQLMVQGAPLDGGQAKQDVVGGPLMVQGQPLDGRQAEQEAGSTTQKPQQSGGPSFLGAILGGLLLGSLIG